MEYKNKQLINYKTRMTEVKKEKKVSFFDPVVNAFREIPISLAKKYVVGVEEVKKQLDKLNK